MSILALNERDLFHCDDPKTLRALIMSMSAEHARLKAQLVRSNAQLYAFEMLYRSLVLNIELKGHSDQYATLNPFTRGKAYDSAVGEFRKSGKEVHLPDLDFSYKLGDFNPKQYAFGTFGK